MKSRNIAVAVLAASLLGLLLGFSVTPDAWRAAPAGAESFRAIGDALFGPYLLAFEILSVLLVAALIGAVYLAWRRS